MLRMTVLLSTMARMIDGCDMTGVESFNESSGSAGDGINKT